MRESSDSPIFSTSSVLMPSKLGRSGLSDASCSRAAFTVDSSWASRDFKTAKGWRPEPKTRSTATRLSMWSPSTALASRARNARSTDPNMPRSNPSTPGVSIGPSPRPPSPPAPILPIGVGWCCKGSNCCSCCCCCCCCDCCLPLNSPPLSLSPPGPLPPAVGSMEALGPLVASVDRPRIPWSMGAGTGARAAADPGSGDPLGSFGVGFGPASPISALLRPLPWAASQLRTASCISSHTAIRHM
mmetsp:Transcript_11/g.26  ORF Transcript_11/g.26 Transcript_11/m.26 type:complete len:244 (+) Transcript_11:343-1074(+)